MKYEGRRKYSAARPQILDFGFWIEEKEAVSNHNPEGQSGYSAARPHFGF
jgi:hypothetical protein